MKRIEWTTKPWRTREVPFSVLRALVLLGGKASVYKIAGLMALTAAEVEARLETWRHYGAVARDGTVWRLLPEPPEPGYPRRGRRHRDSALFARSGGGGRS